MKIAEAKRWIERRYGNETRYQPTRQSPPSEAEMRSAVAQVHQISGDRKYAAARERFLNDGCRRFDRWFAPSPPSVPVWYRDVFSQFASATAAYEETPMNAPVFQIHAVRSELYATLANRPLPLAHADLNSLESLAARANAVPVPPNISANPNEPTKREEYEKAKADLFKVIDGLRNGSLRTVVRSALPYPVSQRPIRITTQWNGVDALVDLVSEYKLPEEMLVQSGPPSQIAPQTTTRWQYGRTQILIELNGLVDASIQVESLQLPSVVAPLDGWPLGLRIAFDIVYESCWQLRQAERFAFVGIWVPAPGDLGDVESFLTTTAAEKENYIRRAHPSMLYRVFVPSQETAELTMGELPVTEWHQRCRILADQQAMLGEAREALFWLNVGAESLLERRMKSHVSASGIPLDLDKLDGVHEFQAAKDAVAEKFPDIVDEIEWPEPQRKPSRFQQIKHYCRKVPDSPDESEMKRQYREVQRKRNALFHGLDDSQVSIDDVRRAMSGFDWLANHLPSY